MCGIFAFIGSRPNMERVRELATLAARRGPHACGWALLEAGGTFSVQKFTGSLAAHVKQIEPAPIIVGHSRLATSGGDSYRDLRDAQPLSLAPGGPVLAHNGVADIDLGEPLATGCDSEALLRLAAQCGGLGGALARLPPLEPYAVILAGPGGLEVAHSGLPLYAAHDAGGTYLCSAPFDGAAPLPERRVVQIEVSMTAMNGAAERLARQPINKVLWVPRDKLRANSWNPNVQAPPEHELLKISIMESGWTQPIVTGAEFEIVDGYHRWLASDDPRLRAMTDGYVPVVALNEADPATLRMSTIRHNRARGTHTVLRLAEIVQALAVEMEIPAADIMTRLGMEDEEVERMLDTGSMTKRGSSGAFNNGWEAEG